MSDKAEIDVPADGTEVRLKRGMPGTYEGQTATVHHQHPASGHSNLLGEHPLVWLECEVIWSHGTADGFWAARAEYVIPPEVHPCGHGERTPGCGGCDPGAIDFVITDDGVRRPLDPTRDLRQPPDDSLFGGVA